MINNIRNPQYVTPDNTVINVTVNIEGFPGDHPYSATASDTAPHGIQLWADLQAGVYGDIAPYVAPVIPPPPVPTQVERQAAAVNAVQKRLDAAAKARGYDDIKSAVSYADEPSVPRFQADGIAFRACRSLTWAKCYEIQAQIAAGTIPEPTLDEFLAMLPPLPVFTD